MSSHAKAEPGVVTCIGHPPGSERMQHKPPECGRGWVASAPEPIVRVVGML